TLDGAARLVGDGHREAAGRSAHRDAGVRLALDEAAVGDGGVAVNRLNRNGVAVGVFVHASNRNPATHRGGIARRHLTLDRTGVDDGAATYCDAFARFGARGGEGIDGLDSAAVGQVHEAIYIHAVSIETTGNGASRDGHRVAVSGDGAGVVDGHQ